MKNLIFPWRFYLCELFFSEKALGVYGPALKEIIHEEFGDGIVSAIDFSIKVERESDPAGLLIHLVSPTKCVKIFKSYFFYLFVAGDRCRLVWSGKFLPYKKF